MTVATSTNAAALQTADVGWQGSVPNWPRSQRRLFLIAGGDHSARDDWTERTADLGRCLAGTTLTVRQAAPDFATFGGLRALLAGVHALGGEEAERTRRDHGELFEALEAQAGADQARASRLAETITFAVTRRISRESHHSALLIDRLVDYLLVVLRACRPFASGLTVVVPDFASWDRPSIRCLCRLATRLDAGDRFAFVVFGPGPEELPAPEADDVAGRIPWARARFVRRLASEPTVAVLHLGPDEREERRPPALPDDFSLALLDVGNALAFQNYERVYLLCDALLARAAGDPEREAQVRRLIGIANAQLSDFPAAERELRRACDASTSPDYRAHLQYLIGLLKTKRVYDLDQAVACYGAGLAILDGSAPDPAAERIERAWLLNGQALVLSLRAKQAGPEEQERLLREAFELEFEAYRLARAQPGPAASYLRHNLCANLTFLLEISRRYAEAIDFWKRSLERYMVVNSPSFMALYEGRLGMLLFKAGRPEEAIETLLRVRELCRTIGDRFYEERVHLALGHVHRACGRPREALAAHRDGCRIASDLRMPDAYLDHAVGMLSCAAAAGDRDAFEALLAQLADIEPTATLVESIRDVPDGVEPAERLARAGVRQVTPSPKMPAYIPSVDMEGAPARDLNRYLVSEGGPLT